MTTELIIQLIEAIIGTGGLIGIFLISERKAAAQIANIEKVNDQWKQIVEQKDKDFNSLNDKYEAAVSKIEKLYDDNSSLRTSLDTANTECAVSKLMRCDCLDCQNRKPPFGSTINPK